MEFLDAMLNIQVIVENRLANKVFLISNQSRSDTFTAEKSSTALS